MSQAPEASTPPSFRVLAVACGIGTALQYFNFIIYGTAAALIFNQIIFVTKNLWFSTFLSFVTLAAGFVAGPVGAILFGHFGDRIGRRRVLQATISLMAVTSFLIAILPTYAAIGVAAPVILVLLRIADGIASGGEIGGAAALAYEHAPAHQRGRYAGLAFVGSNVAAFAAYGFFTLIGLLPRAAELSWGWRVPFLCGTAVAICGIVVRRRLTEGADFVRLKEEGRTLKVPLVTMFRRHPATILLASGSCLGYFALAGVLLVFILSYAPQKLGTSSMAVLIAALCGTATQAVMTLVFALLSDHLGTRRPIMLGGTSFIVLASFPMFWLLQTKSLAALVLTVVVGAAALGAVMGPMAAFFAELFSASLRYSGVGLATMVGSIGLGVTPLIANRIVAATGSTTWVAAYTAFMALVSLGCLLALPETGRAKGVTSSAPVTRVSALKPLGND